MSESHERLPDPMMERETGVHRYLTHLLETGGPRDHLREAVERVAAVTASARWLTIHAVP